MLCFRPKFYYKLGFPVPCRKCLACRKQIANEWSIRLVHESRQHDQNCFITLTFNDKHLPLCRSLCKRTLQLFIKRLRKKLGETKIKYYAVGEYGKKHSREHYHLIIFGWSPPLEDLYYVFSKQGRKYYSSRSISALWTRGFNTVGTVTSSSCRYAAGYVQKKLYGERASIVYAGRLQPFALQSTGLGARYAYENREKIKACLSVNEGNKNIGLPRYYVRVLGISTDSLRKVGELKRLDTRAMYPELSEEEYTELVNSALKQKEANMIIKDGLYG